MISHLGFFKTSTRKQARRPLCSTTSEKGKPGEVRAALARQLGFFLTLALLLLALARFLLLLLLLLLLALALALVLLLDLALGVRLRLCSRLVLCVLFRCRCRLPLQPITQQTISLFFPYWASSGIARSCATSRPCHRTCLFKCSLVHTYAVALSLPRACIRTFPGQLFMRPSSISSLLYVSVYAERSPATPTLELREGRVRVAC